MTSYKIAFVPMIGFVSVGILASTSFSLYTFFYKPQVKWRKKDRMDGYPK